MLIRCSSWFVSAAHKHCVNLPRPLSSLSSYAGHFVPFALLSDTNTLCISSWIYTAATPRLSSYPFVTCRTSSASSFCLFSLFIRCGPAPPGASTRWHAATRPSVCAGLWERLNLLEMKTSLLNFISRRKWPDLHTVLFSPSAGFSSQKQLVVSGFQTTHN